MDSVEFSRLICFFCILIFIFCPSRHLVCDRRQVRITSPWCMSPALGTCHRLLVIVTSPCNKTTASSAPGVFFLSSRPLNGSARNGSPGMAVSEWRIGGPWMVVLWTAAPGTEVPRIVPWAAVPREAVPRRIQSEGMIQTPKQYDDDNETPRAIHRVPGRYE